MNTKTEKEIQAEYKERKIIGGVYVIKNTLKNKLYLDAATDLYQEGRQCKF